MLAGSMGSWRSPSHAELYTRPCARLCQSGGTGMGEDGRERVGLDHRNSSLQTRRQAQGRAGSRGELLERHVAERLTMVLPAPACVRRKTTAKSTTVQVRRYLRSSIGIGAPRFSRECPVRC